MENKKLLPEQERETRKRYCKKIREEWEELEKEFEEQERRIKREIFWSKAGLCVSMLLLAIGMFLFHFILCNILTG